MKNQFALSGEAAMRIFKAIMLVLVGVFSAPVHAAFDTRIDGGTIASFSSNIPGESRFEDNRYVFQDLRSIDVGRRVYSIAQAIGDYNFPDQYSTRCVRNDGVTPCDGTEGPGMSGLLYDRPISFIRRSFDYGQPALAEITATADNGVLRVTARSNSGGPIGVTTPVPGNNSILYSRPLTVTGAVAQITADLHTSHIVSGVIGTIGQATISGHIDGGIYGNGVQPSDNRDPSNILNASVAGARFSFSATNWIPGYACGTFGCPAKNFFAKFGAESGPNVNGNSIIPFTLVVDVINGFKLETFSSLSASASGVAGAMFGSTASIDSIELTPGFSLDITDGSLTRVGDRYSFVPTLAPVPEPASWALFMGGVAAVAWRRRRTLRRSALDQGCS